MKCSHCNKENPPGSRFCQFCGANMEKAVAPSLSSLSPRPTPAAPPQPAPVIPPASQQIKQVGEGGSSIANIWGPFAGYGTRGRHASWLLDNLGDKAAALHETINGRFSQRQVPGSQMKWQTLTAKGLLVERRPFYFIQRGITTVALYIAQFGQDLYISQITYVKGPISNVRVAILAVMILFQLYYSYGFTASLLNSVSGFNPFSSSGGEGGSILFYLCIIGPLGVINGLLLFLALMYSIYKFVREKDFLALLRMPPNEFQEDDTVALEKAVEETVRQSLDSIGIDPLLMPPALETSLRQRII